MGVREIIFSDHALAQLADRGTTQDEVIRAIREGEPSPVKRGRIAFRKTYGCDMVWKGRAFTGKQVMPIVAEETARYVVVTVYVFFLGGGR